MERAARSVFFKDLKPISLKHDHQEGWALCLPSLWDGRILTFFFFLITSQQTQLAQSPLPLSILSEFSLPWLYRGPLIPHPPFKPVTSVLIEVELSLHQILFPPAIVCYRLESSLPF